MKIMVSSFKRSHAHTAALNASDPEAGHCWSKPPLETPGHSWANLSHFLVGSLLLSPASWCSQGFVCALQESVSSVLCKFWWFYGGVGGDFLQEDLCHTQVCCTQSPCSRPLLTCTLTGDTQTWFWLRPVGWTCICALPRSEHLSNQVLGKHTVPGGLCILITSPAWPFSFLGAPQEHHISGVLYVSSGELISGCYPPEWYQPSRISGRRG